MLRQEEQRYLRPGLSNLEFVNCTKHCLPPCSQVMKILFSTNFTLCSDKTPHKIYFITILVFPRRPWFHHNISGTDLQKIFFANKPV